MRKSLRLPLFQMNIAAYFPASSEGRSNSTEKFIVETSSLLIQQHSELVRRFLKAWFENIAWARGHKAETVKLLVPVLNLKPETVGAIYDQLMLKQSADGHFNPAAMKTMPRAIVELGILDKEPDATKLYTEAFLPKP